MSEPYRSCSAVSASVCRPPPPVAVPTPTQNVGTHEEVMVSINEDAYDVVVVGSGGGLVGAYVAASRGLRTLVVEKTDRVGGTTAYSGAGLWFPGSAPLRRAGVDDGVEGARTYLRGIVDDPSRERLQDAFLRAGAQLIEELEQNEWFRSFVYGPVPEYYPTAPGASPAGHTVFPPEIPAAELGEHARLVRDPSRWSGWASTRARCSTAAGH